MKRTLFILIPLFSALIGHSQTKVMSSADIQLALEKLNVTGRVLYVAAHPDDENTRLLSYLANERNYRTAYLSLTRGDGGQNLIGKEQAEPLGIIRTQELLAARRTDGAEQFFTRANDFGYSKNPEETLGFWNRDSILADVVYTIRKFRPDVVICRFPTTGEGGHGHHTASAMLAVEAFEAAADPNKFSYQLSTVSVWQVKRLFWNTFNFGGTNTTSPDQLKIETGVYNPLLGKSYGEIAAESRSMHKSQGFGSARQRGSALEYFKLLKGEAYTSDLFDGIESTWKRLPNSDKLQQNISACLQNYQAAHPEASVPALLQIRSGLLELSAADEETRYLREQKLKEVENLLLACAGLWLEASAAAPIVVPGESMSYSIQILARNKCDSKLLNVQFANNQDSATNFSFKTNELLTIKRTEQLSKGLVFSEPYWLRVPKSIGTYYLPNLDYTGQAENAAALSVEILLELNGQTLKITRPVVYKSTDPVKGEVYRALELQPAVTVNPDAKVYVFRKNTSKKISVLIKSNTSNCKGTLFASAPSNYKVEPASQSYNILTKGEEALLHFTITATEKIETGSISFYAVQNSDTCNQALRRIQYDHIPSQFYLEPAVSELVTVDLNMKKSIKIAYLPGAGDDVAESLKQVGFEVDVLNDEQLKMADLKQYRAVITGVRAFNTNEKLHLQREKLLAYMKEGGNLIVQYNTNSRVGPLQGNIGPYPFTISRDRVTDENAKVNYVKPQHPILTQPNVIAESDWKGWLQERGIYFATELDKQYQTVFSMNDPNEKANEGSLITCAYGKGNFVYTGLAFFRELPAGVSGAYRLIANIISLPQNK